MKTLDDYFRDWEATVFGYGYGSGEPHTLAALKAFMAAIPERQYDYEVLEGAVGAPVAWLLINALCHADLIEYGVPPRYGWLDEKGQALKGYVDARTSDQLAEVCCVPSGYFHCYPDHCNCDDEPCSNPFWNDRRGRK